LKLAKQYKLYLSKYRKLDFYTYNWDIEQGGNQYKKTRNSEFLVVNPGYLLKEIFEDGISVDKIGYPDEMPGIIKRKGKLVGYDGTMYKIRGGPFRIY